MRSIVVLLAALAATAITARMGYWQLDRAAQKNALEAVIGARATLPELAAPALAKTAPQAEAQHHRATRLEGQWLAEHTVFLDNRQMNGRPGFLVITPLQLAPGDAVLVQRGWVPRDPNDRARLPLIDTAPGTVVVSGRVAAPPARLLDFSERLEAGPIRQNLDLENHARALGVALRPLSVVQHAPPGAASDGLARDWPPAAAGVHKHYGYAFQWFALAALIAGLYVWFQLLRPRLHRSAR